MAVTGLFSSLAMRGVVLRNRIVVSSMCEYSSDDGFATDWHLELAKRLGPLGVDLIDCSSGALVHGVRIPIEPGYQVKFASRIRREAGVMTGAVGLITEAAQANGIISSGDADVVLMAREMLRDPYFALHAAEALGAEVRWPEQYLRARG